jgi:hypothetical protein
LQRRSVHKARGAVDGRSIPRRLRRSLSHEWVRAEAAHDRRRVPAGGVSCANTVTCAGHASVSTGSIPPRTV